MNILLLNNQQTRIFSVRVTLLSIFLIGSLLIALLSVAGYGAYRYGIASSAANPADTVISSEIVAVWQQNLDQHQEKLEEYKTLSQQHVDAMTMRMGELQARLLRLDALGQRLTDVAGLDKGEFDFESKPALGGPVERTLQQSYSLPELSALLEKIEQQSASRQQQLRLMDELIVNQKFQREKFIAGRPIKKGWISSYYGYRSDPFNGKRTWHAGVDFAGKEGSPVIAVAGGVVTDVDKQSGYGLMVEISHGSGLVTRYAHCKKVNVGIGEVVQKGQTIALMGSTGRSTGPHVHFEVIKNGKTLNPTKFIHRASR